MKTKTPLAGALALVLCVSVAGPTAANAVQFSTPEEHSVPAADASPALAFSGEELFRGVMFSEGPAAALLNKIQPVSAHDTESLRIIDEVTSIISTEHPEFMETFADSMRSGQPSRVQGAVQEAATVTMDTLIQNKYIDPGVLEASDIGPTCFAIQVFLVVAAAAVYAYAGILQLQAVATYSWYKTTPMKAGQARQQAGELSLEYENWISNLSATLAVK